jgi:hypothetical protein
VSLGPGLVNVGLGVGGIGLVIVRIELDFTEGTVKIVPDAVKIELKNITIRFVDVGESLVETDI